jgi:hypothetical protein
MASVNKKFNVDIGLQVGDDALVIEGATSRAGFGKTDPAYVLDVADTANFDGTVIAAKVGIGTTQPVYELVTENVTVQLGGVVLDNQGSQAGVGSFLGSTSSGELAWVGSGASTLNVIFVAENGNDANDGRRPSTAKRTVKNAASIAEVGDVIRVAGGVYPEQNPISLNPNVSVDGDDLRNTQIIPLNAGQDLFHVDNGCLLQNMSFIGSANTGAMVAYHPLRTNDMTITGFAASSVYVTSYVGTALTPTAGAYDVRSGIMTVTVDNTLTAPSVHSITTAAYGAVSGILTITVPSHGFSTGDQILVEENSLIFRCSSDGYASTISHPRPGEPAHNRFHSITVLDTDSFEINVGSAGITDIHRLEKSEANNLRKAESFVGFTTGSISLTCKSDHNNIVYQHPRVTDPIAGIITAVYAATSDDFEVHVFNSGIGSEYVGVITQSPYVRNCTNFVPDSVGMRIDGDKAMGLKSMVVDSYTQYNQGGIGVSITNNGYAQLVSIFTICDDIAIYCGSGGQCDLTNSNSSFGNKGLVASGVGTESYAGTLNTAMEEEDNIIVVSGLGTQRPFTGQAFYVGELFYNVDSVTMTSAGSGYTSTNPPIVTFSNPSGPGGIKADGVAVVSGFGSVTSIDLFAAGRQYRYGDNPTVTVANPVSGETATATVNIEPTYYTINSATTPTAGVSTITVDQTIPANVGVGSTVPFFRQSLILASSHSFEYIGTGVTIAQARPSQGGVTIPQNQVISENGGKVVHTSTDERGNFLIGDDFTINQQTGTITGDAFNKSIQATLTPLIVALGGAS